jgi:hypothetical protein
MKKTLLLISVALALSACESVPNPWEGMPYQKAQEWRSIGATAQNARFYMSNGFDTPDAKPWIQAGISEARTAITWHRAGFTPIEASKWIQKGFTPEQATNFKKQGLSVQ